MNISVSVILPYYNSEHTLKTSIESILTQTFNAFELILVDNDSEDGSYDIAADYATKDARIKLVSESGHSSVQALIEAISYTKGKYIAFMDAEDQSLPERLEYQRQYLEKNPDTDLVSCCVNPIEDDDINWSHFNLIKWNNRLLSNEDIAVNRFVESPLVHSTVMFRKKLIEKFGGYRESDFPADYELWLRWLHQGVKMYKLSDVLLNSKGSTYSFIDTLERYNTLAFYETKTRYLYDWLKNNNRFFPEVIVWGAGRLSRERFGLLHDLGVIPKFFIDQRANPERHVIDLKFTPTAGKNFIVNYVASRDAREKIKEFLVELGYIEGKDFICIA
jgi:glycosyltransferase involved in cell wall biosynthesis